MLSNSNKVASTGIRWLGPILALVCLWACLSGTAMAQVIVGSISGVVSDPTGAVVPGATVLLTDVNKGYNYNSVTDSLGACRR